MTAALPTRALVVGLGRSGLAAVAALTRAGVEVVATDDRDDAPGRAAATDRGASVLAPDEVAGALAGIEVVVPSPGVPEHAPLLVSAAQAGTGVWSEPELGWRLFLDGRDDVRVLAVTGTNGKTSVTELLRSMLEADGQDAVACGNIGTPFSEAAAQAQPGRVLVAELSSFQLRFCERLRPRVGVLLNVAPDHLDWHRTESAYGRAKARLWQAQQAEDWAVVNADDPTALTLGREHAPAGLARFSGTRPVDPGVGLEDGVLVAAGTGGRGPLLPVGDLALDAPHHRANVAAAASAALLAGAGPHGVATAAAAFRPGRHRLEHVVTVGGVVYVDDSKATNAHAAAAALRAHDRVVWVAGGLAKGVDLGSLGPALRPVRHAVLIGEAAESLAAVCAGAGVPADTAATIEAAVLRSSEVARPGDTVLLAPACASFDMFRDYADRGDRFAAAARALAGGQPPADIEADDGRA